MRLERPSHTTLCHEEAHCGVANIMYVVFPDLFRFYPNCNHGQYDHWETSCTSLLSSGAPSPPVHKTQNMLVIDTLMKSLMLIAGTSFSDWQNTFRQQLGIVLTHILALLWNPHCQECFYQRKFLLSDTICTESQLNQGTDAEISDDKRSSHRIVY